MAVRIWFALPTVTRVVDLFTVGFGIYQIILLALLNNDLQLALGCKTPMARTRMGTCKSQNVVLSWRRLVCPLLIGEILW